MGMVEVDLFFYPSRKSLCFRVSFELDTGFSRVIEIDSISM